MKNSRTVIRTAFKRISDNHSRVHPQLAQRGVVLTYLDAVKSEIKKMVTSYCSFYDGMPLVRPESKQSRSRSRFFQAGVGAEVGVA